MTLLCVLSDKKDAEALVGWSRLIARSLEKEAIFFLSSSLKGLIHEAPDLFKRPGPEDAEAEGKEPEPAPAEEKKSKEENGVGGHEELPGVFVAETEELEAGILDRARRNRVDFIVVGKQSSKGKRGEMTLARQLFDSAPCTVLMLRVGKNRAEECRRILVPSAGGPHAKVALQVASKITKTQEGTLSAFYVEVTPSEESKELGQRQLAKHLSDAGLDDEEVEMQVVVADTVWNGLSKAAEDPADLLLVGGSHAGMIRKALFGTVPDKILADPREGVSVGVIRKPWPLVDRLRYRVESWLDLRIPQLEREDRIALFEKLRSGSLWSFDYVTLIAISTAVATIGLMQNSAAVVIGAMLVAPLMTPILGAGLSLVQGNAPLMRSALLAILGGFFLALITGLLIGVIVPLPELTAELKGRGAPNLLDIFVALFSGFAAAYCIGRPTLSAALPGVAIAAALVPPIATAGVSIARGYFSNGLGALTLFITNVVIIILGAALSFYLGGIRRRRTEGKRSVTWVRVAIALIFAATLGLAWNLGKNYLEWTKPDLARELEPLVRTAVAELEEADLHLIKWDHSERIAVHITAPKPVPEEWVSRLANQLRAASGRDLRVKATTLLSTQSH